jgi:hypothetical protein
VAIENLVECLPHRLESDAVQGRLGEDGREAGRQEQGVAFSRHRRSSPAKRSSRRRMSVS